MKSAKLKVILIQSRISSLSLIICFLTIIVCMIMMSKQDNVRAKSILLVKCISFFGIPSYSIRITIALPTIRTMSMILMILYKFLISSGISNYSDFYSAYSFSFSFCLNFSFYFSFSMKVLHIVIMFKFDMMKNRNKARVKK